MLALAARFLEDLPQVGGYHGVGGEDEGGLVVGGVDCGGVDVLGLCDCCGEDVFEGREGFGLVFGDGGGDDFEVCEADLWRLLEVVLGGIDLRLLYLTCASSCLLLGEAEARITRLPRIMFRAGRSRGNGGRGPRGAAVFAPLGFSVMGSGLSVYGGGLRGAFSSDMMDVCLAETVV